MKRLCIVLVVLTVFGCVPNDPYNALIWNRANVLGNTGDVDTGPWFEWWYYKVVLPDTGATFFFTYGVVNPWDEAMALPASGAYVRMGGPDGAAPIMEQYAVTDFEASYETTDVTVGGQWATDRRIVGSLPDGESGEVSWDIAIEPKWQFNAMGWAMHVPDVTNIAWYPAHADARFSGTIFYRGETYVFENAPGYQDRNWGRTFPEWWAWIAASHFEGYPDTALAIGGGKPMILGMTDAIEGVAIGLHHAGIEYAFRQSHGDFVFVEINFGTWEVEAINTRGQRIVVRATAPCESFVDLTVTTPQGETFHDFETLTGEVSVQLYQWNRAGGDWEPIAFLGSDFAGIEYGRHDLDAFDCFENGD